MEKTKEGEKRMSVKIKIEKIVFIRKAKHYASIWKKKTKDGKFILWGITIDNGHSITSFSVYNKKNIWKRIKEEVRL